MANNDSLGPGWHISPDGYNIITDNGSLKDQKVILQNALNSDLKDIGNPVLSSEITKSVIEELVLQVHKVRNASAPKANEDSQAAPRMLKLTLTDGHSFCQAVEISEIPALSAHKTAPGSKILLKTAKVKSGYILLQPRCCTYLGGKVPALYEKWEISRSLLKNARRPSANPDGPPPWVNFGTKVASTDDRSFKSLDKKMKDSSKQDSEFDNQRKGAIAEAASGAVRKVFGGGVRKPTNFHEEEHNRRKFENRERVPRERKRNDPKEKDTDKALIKPPEKVSLFHFLEEKLSIGEDSKTSIENAYQEPAAGSYNVKKYPNQKRDDFQHRTSNNRNTDAQKNHSAENTNVKPITNSYNSKKYPYQNRDDYQHRASNNNRNVSAQQNSYQNLSNATNAKSDSVSSNKHSATTTVDSEPVDSLTNNMNKISLNSQFASRSLRQHLNLEKPKKEESSNVKNNTWKVGDACLAKYWEDGKFYNASITNVTDNTYVVLFNDYGNVEEVLKSDCKPLNPDRQQKGHQNQRYYPRKFYSGNAENRRNSNKTSS